MSTNQRTHWKALYVNGDNVTYFDSFGVEYIPKEIKKFIENKNIRTMIYRIQANDSILCGYFCINFINFMVKRKNLFSPIYFLLTNMKRMIKNTTNFSIN